MFSYFPFHFLADLRIVLQVLFRILPALSDLGVVVRVPCPAFYDYAAVRRQIQNISFSGNPFAEHDIKFCLPERRRDLILHHFDAGTVAHYFAALLQRFDPADIQTDRRIELQSAASGSRLRIAEHHAHLLAELIDKDHHTVGLADHRSKLPECLGHQAGLKAHMGITHIPVYLRLRHQRRHRVHDYDVNGAGSHHGLRDLQCLFAVIRLRNVKIVNVYADILGIYRIQRVLGVDKSRDAASLLHFCHHM